ncbi:hypothetical protein H6P81_020717 [Aristolochia fimbriata]|uniref:ZCF37 n=1 Tax=Aristolochia fimbriata TaxID=158543 RepID=A0AAV7DYD8_ARIFI|nr:hypothetical protein H6P81_020717 [Aristolochia fimbriata]
MLCGSRSFSHVDEAPWAPEAPRRTRKKNRNPYSGRGLDKFARVLAELEARREKIVSQMGPQEVPLVRFAYSNSEDWVPIVVKLKNPKGEKIADPVKPRNHHQFRRSASACFHPVSETAQKSVLEKKEAAPPLTTTTTTESEQRKTKRSFSWKLKQGGIGTLMKWRPAYNWPLVFVLILLCLAVFGRSFAIICTSVWWYMAPILTGQSEDLRKSLKKDYGRRMSGKKLTGDSKTPQSKASSPRSHLNGR